MQKIIPSGTTAQPQKKQPPRPKFTEVAPGVFEDVIGLLPGEAEYCNAATGRKKLSAAMIKRICNIKTALCEGNKIPVIVARYRGQTGYKFADVAAISAALSRFNGWENPNRYNRLPS